MRLSSFDHFRLLAVFFTGLQGPLCRTVEHSPDSMRSGSLKAVVSLSWGIQSLPLLVEAASFEFPISEISEMGIHRFPRPSVDEPFFLQILHCLIYHKSIDDKMIWFGCLAVSKGLRTDCAVQLQKFTSIQYSKLTADPVIIIIIMIVILDTANNQK